MSSNYSKYDLIFSVNQGKKLTRNQLIENYAKFLSSNNTEENSVFGIGFQSFINEMFDILNTNKAPIGEEEELDANEIAALKSFFDDGDNTQISYNDLSTLLQKAVDKVTQTHTDMPITTPEEMYTQAQERANGDMCDSSYIQDLSNDIDGLHSMISIRRFNSTDIINKYNDKINDLIQNSSVLKSDFKRKYEETKNEISSIQENLNNIQLKMQENEKELDKLKAEQTLLKQELNLMSEDEKKENQGLIEGRNSKIDDIQSKIVSLNSQNQSLMTTYLKESKNLSVKKQKLSNMTEEAKRKDKSISQEIEEYQNNIEIEKQNCKKDVDSYTSRIKMLNDARDYAIQCLSYSSNSGEGASHRNDNAISFENVKYNSKKGQDLANDVYNHRVGFTGYCSRYVANALARTGLGHERANAEGMDDLLKNNSNFQAVTIHSKEELGRLPAGCILVYEKGAAGYSAQYGHIEVTMGDGTAVSDGVTHNIRYSENITVFVPV